MAQCPWGAPITPRHQRLHNCRVFKTTVSTKTRNLGALVRVAPKQSAEIVWKFSKAGTFEYSCLIPDHRDYGMTGRVIVK